MNRVAAACAAVPGATEDVASRALSSFEAHRVRVPMVSRRAARQDRRMRNELRRVAVREALENERRARTVGMGPIAALVFWAGVRWGIFKILDRLWTWWWQDREEPRAAGSDARNTDDV